ncbi:MAG: hypothetical protein M1401_08305 [Chloroflexi bacterium]|nr:hypothetical protein [Chloroflexota bacterium]
MRDFFAALEAKDYGRLDDLTSGQAQVTADRIAAEAQKAEQDNAVTLQPRVTRLDFLGSEPRGNGVAERVASTIDIDAQMGLFTIRAQSKTGEAVSTVDKVDERTLITNIAGDLS